MDKNLQAGAPQPPRACLSLGVTGHRAEHAGVQGAAAALEATLARVLDLIDAQARRNQLDQSARIRLHSMLADGVDQLAAREALQKGWDLVTPLAFGADLNCAINARPQSVADARAILSGAVPADGAVAARASAIQMFQERALVFALADRDDEIAPLFLASLEASASESDRTVANATISARVALAARLVIEQSDLIVAVWDGAQASLVGGTGHTVHTALSMGAAVVWINPSAPDDWRVLRSQEALLAPAPRMSEQERATQLNELVREALEPAPAKGKKHTHPPSDHAGMKALDSSEWRNSSNPLWHTYRRVEAIFGGEKHQTPFRSLRQTYETPEGIAEGSGAGVLAQARNAPGVDHGFVEQVASLVLPRFAWADGISSHLSDTYRSGMVINFMLSALAIVGGIAYFPLAGSEAKWGFALFEFVLLCAILLITHLGQRRGWHSRWVETRRAAEYLRHAPILLALGAARPPGRWPRGAETSWPEWYARQALREVGLPRITVTSGYLRHCLSNLLDVHVTQQRDYHHAKAHRLTNVHYNLDRLSEFLFQVAVASVALYLVLQLGPRLHILDAYLVERAAKIFTFLGVLLPTFGGAIAGIRYFGDFERFAAISEVTAQKLDAVHARIELLLTAPPSKLDYQVVAELAHAADDIVVSEIENWQAVFGGKQITVPV